VKVKGLEWIRLHYAYPTGFPEEVIDLMASEEKICNYLDIPIQHVNNQVLEAMGRGHDRAKLERLLYKFREKIPDVAIRTTILTGFPGETEEAYTELLDFIGSFRFERLGVFPYSHEEDTPAYRHLKDQIPDRVKAKRAGILMDLQQSISLQLNEQKIGKILKVLIDRREGEYFVGRSQYDSPEVDNEVLVKYNPAIHPGRFYQVRITEAEEFDLYGEVVQD
jgi:ribosomal protein S12 methylthiotransferase